MKNALIQISALSICICVLFNAHNNHMDEYQKRYDVMEHERTKLKLIGTIRQRRLIRERNEDEAYEALYTKFEQDYERLS